MLLCSLLYDVLLAIVCKLTWTGLQQPLLQLSHQKHRAGPLAYTLTVLHPLSLLLFSLFLIQ